MTNLGDRITVDPNQYGGGSCVGGMRIRVSDVLDLLGSGLTREELLHRLPDFEPDVISARPTPEEALDRGGDEGM